MAIIVGKTTMNELAFGNVACGYVISVPLPYSFFLEGSPSTFVCRYLPLHNYYVVWLAACFIPFETWH